MKPTKSSFIITLLLASYVCIQAFSVDKCLHTSPIRNGCRNNCSFQPSKTTSTTSVQLYNDDKVYSTPSNMNGYKLDVKKVRQLAKAHHYKEIYFNRPSNVVSFSRKNRNKNSQYPDSSARITVYWTTATVITCMNNQNNKQTQLVRRNIDMKTLESIFNNPRNQKGLGYPLNCKTNPDGSVFDVASLEEEAKAQIHWLNEEMKLMQQQRDQAETLIHDFEEKRHAEHLKSMEKRRNEKLHRSSIVEHVNPPVSPMKQVSQVVKSQPHTSIVKPLFVENPYQSPSTKRHVTASQTVKSQYQTSIAKPFLIENPFQLPSTKRHVIPMKEPQTVQSEPHTSDVKPPLVIQNPHSTKQPVTDMKQSSQPVRSQPHMSVMKAHATENPHQPFPTNLQVQEVENLNNQNSFSAQRQALVQKPTLSPLGVSPPVAQTNRGKYITYWVHEAKKVEEYFNPNVISLACGGKSSIFLYENGEWNFTSGLARGLFQILNARQGKAMSPPTYVALGSDNRYFIKFKDGSSHWVGCDDMTNVLNSVDSNRAIKSVAFGEDWDSYFLIFEDGGWKFNNIPYSLEILINRIKDSIANKEGLEYLDCVTLGGEGQYFVRAMTTSKTDFQYWFGGLTSQSAISDTSLFKDRIQFVDFGDEGTYIMRYS